MLKKEIKSLLSNSAFRNLYFAQLVNWLGSSSSTIALLFAMLDSEFGVSGAGLLLGVRAVPSVIFGIAGGVFADRYRKRTLVVFSGLSIGVAQVILAGLLTVSNISLFPLLFLVFITGSVQAVSASSLYSLTPELVPKSQIQSAQAIMRLTRNATSIIGPVTGGLIASLAHPAWLILFSGLASVLSGFLLLRLPIMSKVKAKESVFGDLRDGWGEIRSRPWLYLAIPAFSLALLAWSGGYTILGSSQIIAQGGDSRTWGLLTGFLAAGYIIGGLLALKWRPRNPVSYSLACQAITGLPLVALAFNLSFPILAFSVIVAGIAMDQAGIVWATALQTLVPKNVLGRVSSYDYVGSFGLIPVGYVLAQPMANFVGSISVALIIFGGFIVVPTLITALLPSTRNLKPAPAQ